MSLEGAPQICMDKWDLLTSGRVYYFINSRNFALDPAIETSAELVLNGWKHSRINLGYSKD